MVQQKEETFMCSNCAKTITFRGGKPEEMPPCPRCGKGKWELLAKLGDTSSGVHVGTCSACGGDLEMVPGGVVVFRCTKCGHVQPGRSPVIGN